MKTILFACSGLFLFLLMSCGEVQTNQHHGPIVLGDSATIVTETDPRYLRDMVMDMEVKQTATHPVAVKEEPKAASVVKAPEKAAVKEQAEGFIIDFGTIKMKFTGIKTTEYQKQNPLKDAGVSYACTQGDLRTSNIIISGAKNVKIQQRYQTKLGLRSALGTLSLADLGIFTSDWVALAGKKEADDFSFDLSNLKKADFKKISNRSLKNALQKQLRRQGADKSTVQKWLSAIRRTRNANDAPCEIMIQNVQWRISGTDVKGKSFHKTIRLDAKAV